MKFSKLLPLAFVGILALTGCNKNQAPGEVDYGAVNTKIIVWATAQEEAVIKKVVDAYNAKQTEDTRKFQYEFKAVQEGDCGSALAKDATVAGAPALALIADDQIENLQSKNIILEVKGSYKDRVLYYNSEVAVTGASSGDKLFGFPVTSDNGYFLWYNKSALTDQQVGSLESILEVAKATNKKMFMDVSNGWYVNSFFMSPEVCGAESLRWHKATEGTGNVYDITWDSDAGAAAAEYVSGKISTAVKDGNFIKGSNEVLAAGFLDTSIIAGVSGTWMENDLKAAATANGYTLGAVKLPTFTYGGKAHQMASFTGSKVFVINKTRPVQEQKAAAALADLLTNKESQLTRFEERSALPCNKEAVQDKRYTEHVTLGGAALNAQNNYAAVQSLSAEDRYWSVGEAIGTAIYEGTIAEGGWKEFLKTQCNILRRAQ